VTTATGFDRGRQLYTANPAVMLIRFPLDFTGAIRRVLDAYRPRVVVLMELEVWPNFMRQCMLRGIDVMLANGRITEPSFNRYRWIGPVARTMFQRLAAVAAQDQLYAQRFADLGVPGDRLHVLGTMKFDNAQVVRSMLSGAAQLADEVGLVPGRAPIWVAGSTGPGEEQIVLDVYRALLKRFPRLRCVIVPRKPERFDDVARLIEQNRFVCVRRSLNNPPPDPDPAVPPVVLGDTMGELRKFYSLADVVFVGRSLVDLGPQQHGSDMIEPAALGKPVVVGPHTHNFAEAMLAFRRADAILEADDAEVLEQSIRVLLHTPAEAAAMAQRAQRVVLQQQGATDRHVMLIEQLLDRRTVATHTENGQ
ncbi:MAG TPA: glycosyltransferase N-terminal domain-containing protein, partial [Tepidisphaeraceae bacterium]|nr:glycosyltransferase N-terminal domain-containing protein [Tepidisphaeraceae bacterium]